MGVKAKKYLQERILIVFILLTVVSNYVQGDTNIVKSTNVGDLPLLPCTHTACVMMAQLCISLDTFVNTQIVHQMQKKNFQKKKKTPKKNFSKKKKKKKKS